MFIDKKKNALRKPSFLCVNEKKRRLRHERVALENCGDFGDFLPRKKPFHRVKIILHGNAERCFFAY